ncbi:MAG TPA: hypothetical protein VGP26_14590 [Actinophytocola sp.]|jgi:hypothetical protein|nr:hypothetical protein [Actinophytocola sp.]
MDTNPAPYVPGQPPSRDESHLRPWQRHRPGESEVEYQRRLNRTCFACGAFIVDPMALDAHEASHTAR